MEKPRYLEFVVFIASIVVVAGITSSIFQKHESSPTKIIASDVLVYGGSLGGVTAAITAAENGIDTILVLDASNVGGQAVESGNSAFDDTQSAWENYGIYAELKKFLKNKYPATGTGSYGLGEAVVGEVASLPRDIEDFFLSRMEGNKNLRILRGYQLSEVMRDHNILAGAKFINTGDRTEELLIRFQYLIDGTQTGQVFDKARIPYSIGFDSIEETGEINALPGQVKEYLINGYKKDKITVGAFGNRVQAIATPFALADKGYPGDFYPISDSDHDCWSEVSGEQNYIKGSRVLESKRTGCSLTIHITPDFDDTYDVYLINPGNTRLKTDVTFPVSGAALSLDRSIDADERFSKVGTFFAAREQPLSLVVHAPFDHYRVEGALLIKRNLHQAPIVVRSPDSSELSLTREGLSPVNADIYAVTKADDERSNLALFVDGVEVMASKIGPRTYAAFAVKIGLHPRVDLGEAFSLGISTVQIIPSGSVVPLSQTLLTESGSDIDMGLVKNDSHFSTAKLLKERSFHVDEDGEYLFSIDWFKSKWALFDLYDVDNQKAVIFFPFKVQNYSREQGNPLLSIQLKKGVNYRVRVGLSADTAWTPFALSVSRIDQRHLYRGIQLPPAISSEQFLSGMYDIWVKGPREASVTIESPIQKNTIQLSTADTYGYGGKFFLHNQYDLRTNGQTNELIAIPNYSTDVYVVHATKKSLSGSLLKISQLPAGYYRVVVIRKDKKGIDSLEIKNNDGSVESVPFNEANGTFVSQSTYLHAGSPIGMTLKNAGETDTDIYFFEEAPNSEENSFFLTQHPIFRDQALDAPLREEISQFSFRNIVSAKNLFTMNVRDISLADISRDTQGVTIIIDPSNDYAPVLASDLESSAVAERSRSLSYAYYYWLKYDAKLNKENLGCTPGSSFICDPRRVQLVVGIYSDRKSPFPPKPYYREGRRMKAVQMTSENDLLFRYRDCAKEQCDDNLCFSYVQGRKYCLLKEQKPVIFPDAVGSSYYQIDVHSFFTRKEFFTDLRDFTKAMKDIGLLSAQQTLFSRFQMAMPSEVRLGSLLSASGTNMIAASMNIGVTQITNGAYRIHANELSIGQSAGYFSAFCFKKNKRLLDVYRDPKLLKEFQHYLVEKGVNLYPIEDVNESDLLRKAVQHLIVDGLLKKQIHVLPSDWWSTYSIQPSQFISQDDDPIVSQIFGKSAPAGGLTMNALILVVGRLTQAATPQEVLQAGKNLQMLSENDDQKVLEGKITKAALYKAYYLKRGRQSFVSDSLIR